MPVLHLVVLQGGGDTTIDLVTAEQFAWINSDYPMTGQSSWTEKDPQDGHEVDVTCGIGENDRALQVNGLRFITLKAAFAYARKHNHEISDEEFHGGIY